MIINVPEKLGMDKLEKSFEADASGDYALRVRLPSESEALASSSDMLLYGIKSELENLNKTLALVVKQLSLITEIEIEGE